MTVGWFIFSVVMPAIVVGMGLLLALFHTWSLRREDRRAAAAAPPTRATPGSR